MSSTRIDRHAGFCRHHRSPWMSESIRRGGWPIGRPRTGPFAAGPRGSSFAVKRVGESSAVENRIDSRIVQGWPLNTWWHATAAGERCQSPGSSEPHFSGRSFGSIKRFSVMLPASLVLRFHNPACPTPRSLWQSSSQSRVWSLAHFAKQAVHE